MMVDGVETKECPQCYGKGEVYCGCCGQSVGECNECDGSGEVPIQGVVA